MKKHQGELLGVFWKSKDLLWNTENRGLLAKIEYCHSEWLPNTLETFKLESSHAEHFSNYCFKNNVVKYLTSFISINNE